jgi:hypothetical protein
MMVLFQSGWILVRRRTERCLFGTVVRQAVCKRFSRGIPSGFCETKEAWVEDFFSIDRKLTEYLPFPYGFT